MSLDQKSELLASRLALLYEQSPTGDLVATNEWERKPPPLLHVVRDAPLDGVPVAWGFRQDVPADLRASLNARFGTWRRQPFDLAEVLLSTLRPIGASEFGGGPVARLKSQPQVAIADVVVANQALLQPLMDDWVPDIPHRNPMLVRVVDGVGVAVCASVRISPEWHEAGVETVASQRGQGHACAVVNAWSQAVLDRGAQPLYTTTWDNAASQAVAARCGFSAFAADLTIR